MANPSVLRPIGDKVVNIRTGARHGGALAPLLGPLERFTSGDVSLSTGDVILRQGGSVAALYIVRMGALKGAVLLPEGDEHVVGFFERGDLLSVRALGGDDEVSTVSALTSDTRLAVIPAEGLQDALCRDPAIRVEIYQAIGRAFAHSREQAVILGRRDASSRVALFLEGLRCRRRMRGESAERLILPMSRHELANYLGLTIETTSRVFSRLRTRRVLRVKQREVEIVDDRVLAAIAAGDGDGATSSGPRGVVTG